MKSIGFYSSAVVFSAPLMPARAVRDLILRNEGVSPSVSKDGRKACLWPSFETPVAGCAATGSSG
jgi:hypothetical protein